MRTSLGASHLVTCQLTIRQSIMTSHELNRPGTVIHISPPRALVIGFEDLLCRQSTPSTTSQSRLLIWKRSHAPSGAYKASSSADPGAQSPRSCTIYSSSVSSLCFLNE
ncbi:hypothetical protein PDIG_83900 [Penicillium digitatum PHI26]|uniref:Uncharacterized protein n=2 Tax=Penicillium digitatum TaxID=36651 RepID=K9FWJ8_PEND2|nr:hypothetical protein PDIP_89390 [Penicillium digitatum Pd1]EKV04033.1 hypothetical protein PDIP_89390 [Penicillium digitatum Pd1]EKV05411.1 hypothetical protein PDIG_83900 [Penicillium digitatum PHI26]